MIELEVFCDPDRPKLRPWSVDGHTYATDGHICIRVARREDVPERDDAPDAARFFADPPAEGLVPLPSIEMPKPTLTRCEECDGSGYKHDCPDCGCECAYCDGKGQLAQRILVRFGRHLFESSLWRKLAYLPNVRLAAEPDQHKRFCFMFDGGDGVTMPVSGVLKDDLVVEAEQVPPPAA